MYCPTCKEKLLKPTKIEQGLPAMGCSHCGGALLSLLHYRDWRERGHFKDMERANPYTKIVVDDSTKALTCPICSRLMTKYKITSDKTNRLDLCANCDEAWLDGGEWTLLKALELTNQLPAVFTDAWQFKLRTDAHKLEHRQRYLALLGEADLLEAERIRDWLSTHPKRADILTIINSKK